MRVDMRHRAQANDKRDLLGARLMMHSVHASHCGRPNYRQCQQGEWVAQWAFGRRVRARWAKRADAPQVAFRLAAGERVSAWAQQPR